MKSDFICVINCGPMLLQNLCNLVNRSLVHTEQNISYLQHFILGLMLTICIDLFPEDLRHNIV